MLWLLIVVLLLLWIGGYFVASVGSIIHLLLAIALIVLIYQLTTGRRGL